MTLTDLFRLLLLAAVTAAAVRAESSDLGDELEYEPYIRQDSLFVRVNLAPLISAKRVNLMQEGVELSVDYRLALQRPRRFWGSEQIAESRGQLRLLYRILTEDYSLVPDSPDTSVERRLPSLGALHQFLADSITKFVAEVSDVDRSKRYVLELTLTIISLTDLNLAADGKSSEEPGSPVKYLFRQFLELTGYGRESVTVVSRPFSLSELEERE